MDAVMRSRFCLVNAWTDSSRLRHIGYINDLIRFDAVRWLDEVIVNPPIAFHSTRTLAQMFPATAGGGIVMSPAFAR